MIGIGLAIPQFPPLSPVPGRPGEQDRLRLGWGAHVSHFRSRKFRRKHSEIPGDPVGVAKVDGSLAYQTVPWDDSYYHFPEPIIVGSLPIEANAIFVP